MVRHRSRRKDLGKRTSVKRCMSCPLMLASWVMSIVSGAATDPDKIVSILGKRTVSKDDPVTRKFTDR